VATQIGPVPARAAAGHSPTTSHSRISGVDGVRGLAIVLVVIEHAGFTHPWAGGTGGVTIFFVLSGFLITRLLITEHDRTGRISLPKFWMRRGVRLLPAMWVFLAVNAAVFALVGPSFPGRDPISLSIPVLLYYANYAQLLGPMDYLSHTWSLAVEEQFYVVWPLLALVGLRVVPRRLLWVVLAVITGVGVAVRLHVGGQVPLDAHQTVVLTRSLQTNFLELALGATLAAVLDRVRRVPRVPSLVALVAAVLLLDVIPYQLAVHHSPLYTRATSSLWFAAAGVILLVSGLTAQRSWLTWPVLTYLGRRSYAWYLYHFPFVWAATHGGWAADLGGLTTGNRNVDGLIGGALGLLAAEVSWRLVEQPANRVFRRWLAARRQVEPVEGASEILPAPASAPAPASPHLPAPGPTPPAVAPVR